MAGFADAVAKWADKAEHRITLAHRKIALEAFTRVVMRSPVDTGRFRGNWQVAIDNIPQGFNIDVMDPTGSEVLSEVQEVVNTLFAGSIIYLVNNLPYAKPLEDGWSQQAPMGMVAITVVEFQPMVKAIAEQLAREA